MKTRVFAFLMGLATLTCSACTKGPGGCAAVVPPPTTLVWPTNGSTGVDPLVGVIYVSGLESSVTLTSPGASVAGKIITSPPTPTPPPAAPPNLYGAVTVPALAAATTYTVTAVNPGYCGGSDTTVTLGSFTTK